MKNFIAICITCLVFLGPASAQMDLSVTPMSLKFSSLAGSNISEIKLSPFSTKDLEQFDYNDSKNGKAPHFAHNVVTNISPANTGTWATLPDGGAIWRIQITGPGAQGLIPLFNRLYLPPGATLHVYMPGREETLGAFTHANTPQPVSFCCGLIHGESCVIEYYEPANQKGKGILSIEKVGYAYRWVNPLAKSLESGSGPCEVNVACSEGDNWRDQIKAVAMILVVDTTGEANCSGSLINNARKDCTPYLLSAEHCTGKGVSALEYNQWVFYFNYRGASCTDSVGPQTDIVNGCQKIADSEDGDSATASDFLFLQLNQAPPSSYNIFYAGWDATGAAPDSGVCISYPAADIEKISTYTGPAVSTSWANVAQNTHWLVQWVTTANGHGVTEPGSSGSPLFNHNGLIAGHLTGGGSCCTVDGCNTNPAISTGPDVPDYFGKVAYDWISAGVSDSTQLKPWLDPDNTGATTLQGMYPPCGSIINNDAGIQAILEPNGNTCSSSVAPIIVLRNYGANTLTSVTLNYSFDNGTFMAYSWSGSLLAGSTALVTLPAVTLTTGAHTFTVISTGPNGLTDTNPGNDTLTSSLYIINQGGSLNLELKTDTVGRKTTWQVTDASNNVVASGGPYPDLTGGTTYNIPFCLPIACYTFTIFSSAGNGMDAGVQGNFVLTGQAGGVTYATLTNPSFGSQEVHNFCLQSSGINNVASFAFEVIPNPSTGMFNIVMNNSDIKNIRVFDVTGRIMIERSTAEQNVILDLSAESRGIYILQVETGYGTAVQKLVLK